MRNLHNAKCVFIHHFIPYLFFSVLLPFSLHLFLTPLFLSSFLSFLPSLIFFLPLSFLFPVFTPFFSSLPPFYLPSLLLSLFFLLYFLSHFSSLLLISSFLPFIFLTFILLPSNKFFPSFSSSSL